jgi:hypothetical protein
MIYKKTLVLICLSVLLLILNFPFYEPNSPTQNSLISKLFYMDENLVNYGTYEFNSNCSCRKDEKIFVKIDTLNTSIYLNDRKLYSLFTKDFLNMKFTCNIYNVLRRGLDQKIYSYSVFSNKERYSRQIKNITRQIKNMLNTNNQKWTLRFYHDHTINSSLICETECLKDKHNEEFLDNADFCDMKNLRLSFSDVLNQKVYKIDYLIGTLWRYFPIYDSFVEVFSARDSDSNVLEREVDSVNYWLKQEDKVGHVMRGK